MELIRASKRGDVEAVRALLEQEADIEQRNKYKMTALHCASYLSHIQVVEVLLRNGANVRAISMNGWSPLHYASHSDCTEVVKVLLENGAQIDVRDRIGRTPEDLTADETILKIFEDWKNLPEIKEPDCY